MFPNGKPRPKSAGPRPAASSCALEPAALLAPRACVSGSVSDRERSRASAARRATRQGSAVLGDSVAHEAARAASASFLAPSAPAGTSRMRFLGSSAVSSKPKNARSSSPSEIGQAAPSISRLPSSRASAQPAPISAVSVSPRPIVAVRTASAAPMVSGLLAAMRRAPEIAAPAAVSAVRYSSGLDSPRTSAERQHPASV